MIKLNNKGQTLIEALIALGVSVVIVGAIALSIISGINNATFSKNQNLATAYAQEGMDIVHQQSESDWETFKNIASGTYCLDQNATSLDSGSDCISVITPNISSFFLRKVKIDPAGSGCSSGEKVSVIVAWSDGKCTGPGNSLCHNITLDSCITQINSVTGP